MIPKPEYASEIKELAVKQHDPDQIWLITLLL
jgi:hypothetical protein